MRCLWRTVEQETRMKKTKQNKKIMDSGYHKNSGAERKLSCHIVQLLILLKG